MFPSLVGVHVGPSQRSITVDTTHFSPGPTPLLLANHIPPLFQSCPRHVLLACKFVPYDYCLRKREAESSVREKNATERMRENAKAFCRCGGLSGGADYRRSAGADVDVGERWRMLRCGGAQEKTVMNQLRFRPIAPKPVTGDSGSGGSLFDNKNTLLSKPRSKRKYVRVRKNIGHKRRTRTSSSEEEKKTVTLQLLPEKTELSSPASDLNLPVGTNASAAIAESIHQQPPVWLNFHNRVIYDTCAVQGPDLTATVKRVVVESWVTVEWVTDSTCMEARALGCTDVDRMKNLEADTCPGFISDGLNRVQWVNTAYRRMLTVREGNDGQSPEIRVWLVIRERLPFSSAAFSCRVRIQYTWQKEKWSRTVPCDVWRMDGGGFAWRLDVEAALSLGR